MLTSTFIKISGEDEAIGFKWVLKSAKVKRISPTFNQISNLIVVIALPSVCQ